MNWFGAAVPGVGDRAVFALAGQYDVHTKGSAGCLAVLVSGGAPRLLLGGGGVGFAGKQDSPAILIASGDPNAARLTIEGGTAQCGGINVQRPTTSVGPGAFVVGAGAQVFTDGASVSGVGSKLHVRGAGATLEAADSVNVAPFHGSSQVSGRLIVAEGGLVRTGYVSIGGIAGLFIGNGVVELEDGTLEAAFLDVGQWGHGNVDVGNGAALRTGRARLGVRTATIASRGTVTVHGPYASWRSEESIDVGVYSPAAGQSGYGRIHVLDGGTLQTATLGLNGRIVAGEIIRGAELLVEGAGASVDVSGTLGVGVVDSGRGTFIAENGASVSAGTMRVGLGPGAGEAAVQGGATLSVAGAMEVAVNGEGSLVVRTGGRIECGSSVVGRSPAHAAFHPAASLTVEGPASAWTVVGALEVGQRRPMSLVCASGAEISTGSVTAARDAGSSCTISIASGSLWVNDGEFAIGRAPQEPPAAPGQLASLSISADSSLRTGSLVLGSNAIISAGSMQIGGAPDGAPGTHLEVLRCAAGSFVFATSCSVLPSGLLEGSGSVLGNVVNGGVLAPGSPVGTMVINGTFTQSSGGELVVEIDQSTSGAGHDALTVAGAATLGGALRVALVGGSEPARGARFSVLAAVAVTGAFHARHLPTHSDPLLRWWAAAGADRVSVGVRHIADVNYDDQITFADLNIVLGAYGSTGEPGGVAGDADEDGVVGFRDLNLVLSYFGV